MNARARLVHDVYFELVDASPAKRQRLVDACYDELAGIDGVVLLAAGVRDPELARDVNDRRYDVSLHVWFADRAAHDAYQEAPAHQRFVAANKDNWRSVRVFDSTVAPRGGDLAARNAATVQRLYAAFGRGDVPAILELLHPEVAWEADAPDHGVPWLVPRRGRDNVRGFFETLTDMEFHRFEPRAPMANERQVAVPVAYDLTWRPTMRRLVGLEIHLWTFDADGMVTQFRHFMDTKACCDAVAD